MPDDIDLFADAPPLKRCDGCGNYFEEQELKKCRVCGEYFCPTCRKTHDCRVKQNPAPQIQPPRAAPVYTAPVTPAPAANPAPAQTPLVRPPQHSAPRSAPVVPPVYAAPAPVPEPKQPSVEPEMENRYPAYAEQPTPVYAEPEHEEPQDDLLYESESSEPQPSPAASVTYPEEIQCSGCGLTFPKSEMRQCHKCGAILCPECRTHHKCPPKEKKEKVKKEKKVKGADDDFASEPNLANEQRGKKFPFKLKKDKGVDNYDDIMNFQESKKKQSSGKSKKIILFVILGVVVAAAIVFLLLNLLGVIAVIPGISGALGGNSIIGDWKATYNGVSGTVTIKDNGTGIVSSVGFLGLKNAFTQLRWEEDDDGNYAIITGGMSQIIPGPITLSDGQMTLSLINGDKVTFTR